jgi:hypothetical protein
MWPMQTPPITLLQLCKWVIQSGRLEIVTKYGNVHQEVLRSQTRCSDNQIQLPLMICTEPHLSYHMILVTVKTYEHHHKM